MKKIVVPATELWDEVNEKFISTKEQTLQLEHSLVSLSKWESKWKIPFMDNKEKTSEQVLDYIRCMTLTQNVDPNVYRFLTRQNIKEVMDYINDSMTATWFSDKDKRKQNREKVTSEKIYYWMIAFNIPFECQKWHLNRLITLIRVCEAENAPKKKMSKRELMARNRMLNEQRRRKMNSKG